MVNEFDKIDEIIKEELDTWFRLGFLIETKKMAIKENEKLAIYQEICKDIRMNKINKEKENNKVNSFTENKGQIKDGTLPASDKQIAFAKKLGIDATGMTKQQASDAISRKTGK